MGRLITAFRSLPFPSQVAVVGGLLLLLIFVAGGVGGIVSAWKDSRFDKREAEREEQRQQLETEREQAIGRATAAETRAKELEGQTRILEVTIAAQGQRAEKLKEELENEDKRYQEELAAVGQPIDPVEQCRRLCSKLHVKDCPCD